MVNIVRTRKPTPKPAPKSARTGSSSRVAFDDLGNAVWQWSPDDPLPARLDGSALSLADELPPPSASVTLRRVSPAQGYNPYESGLLDKTPGPARKRDLRELSKWIEQQRQTAPKPKA